MLEPGSQIVSLGSVRIRTASVLFSKGGNVINRNFKNRRLGYFPDSSLCWHGSLWDTGATWSENSIRPWVITGRWYWGERLKDAFTFAYVASLCQERRRFSLWKWWISLRVMSMILVQSPSKWKIMAPAAPGRRVRSVEGTQLYWWRRSQISTSRVQSQGYWKGLEMVKWDLMGVLEDLLLVLMLQLMGQNTNVRRTILKKSSTSNTTVGIVIQFWWGCPDRTRLSKGIRQQYSLLQLPFWVQIVRYDL